MRDAAAELEPQVVERRRDLVTPTRRCGELARRSLAERTLRNTYAELA
jgi:C4-dicarboxylate-specific signal transduction histidine kinase